MAGLRLCRLVRPPRSGRLPVRRAVWPWRGARTTIGTGTRHGREAVLHRHKMRRARRQRRQRQRCTRRFSKRTARRWGTACRKWEAAPEAFSRRATVAMRLTVRSVRRGGLACQTRACARSRRHSSVRGGAPRRASACAVARRSAAQSDMITSVSVMTRKGGAG